MRETWDFGALLTAISEGELRDEVTDEFKALVEELYERSQASERTLKGTLTITLDVNVSGNGMLAITPNVTGKLPKKIRRDTPFWIGKNGLTQNNPKQTQLFREVREVGGTLTVKEALAEGE